MNTDQLRAGRAFQSQVQTAFVKDLLGATALIERSWRMGARRGFVDIAIGTATPERASIIIEIKGTDWNKIDAERVRRNGRRHLNQLQGYLDTAIDEMESHEWDSVAGALLYPRRPESVEKLEIIEGIAASQAIMVAGYEDADWARVAS